MKQIGKRLVLLILVSICCFSVCSAGAVAHAEEEFVYAYDDNRKIVNYKGPGGKVVIPQGVTTIGAEAFSKCETLISVTLPDSVTTIQRNAFSGCSNLISVNLPHSLTSIGHEAFKFCKSLTAVTIPGGVTAIEQSTFGHCSALTSVVISSGVTKIGDYAFTYCFSLPSVTLPDSVTFVGSRVFESCDSLTAIQVGAGNGSYQSINGVLFTKDGKTLVSYPIGKTDTSYTVPKGVTTITHYAFYGCKSLTSVEIPESVKTIEYSAFSACTSLSQVKMWDNTKVENDAFRETLWEEKEEESGDSIIANWLWFHIFLHILGTPEMADYLLLGLATAILIPLVVFLPGWIKKRKKQKQKQNPLLWERGVLRQGDYGYRVEKGQAVIVGYYGAGDPMIPPALGGLPVTAVEEHAFDRR